MWVSVSDDRKGSAEAGADLVPKGTTIKSNIAAAREIQINRQNRLSSRGEKNLTKKEVRLKMVGHLKKSLSDEARVILETSIKNLGLSMRAADSVLLVARTIADLVSSQTDKRELPLSGNHILEALSYRKKF
jgi:predicted ATPase with chaperone activity